MYRPLPIVAVRVLALSLAVAIPVALLANGVFAPAALAFQVTSHNVEPNGTIGVQPDRQQLQVAAGQHTTFPVVVVNRTGRTLRFAVRLLDADGAAASNAFLVERVNAPYGAAAWITLDHPGPFVLAQGQQAQLQATVDVPASAGPGANYALVEVSTKLPAGSAGGAGVSVPAALQSQVLVTIAGTLRVAGHIADARSTRWADQSGERFVPVDATWHNDGNATDTVSGDVQLRSIFGNVAATVPVEQLLVARGAHRSFHAVWQQPPLLGVFRPTVRMHGSDGAVHTRRLGYVLVTPPWYYVALVVAALLLPLAAALVHRRRARRGDDAGEDGDDDEEDGAAATS